ncbi:glycine--tRNA ligase subunit beta [Phenylobacterium montanum]|uniref:Glycine--tRNA ligase beta subunit n=1 Tax=Phenylobacterium montanum TaxID=2823693 RepID=A0A975FZ37_9CAUL|nr:glycine--tRNA ligase subunit beta [Caulobacter sp. S6]QUD88085.1 glycine--tRNA ligase subunit beta [Caulobacter sp. S6]
MPQLLLELLSEEIPARMQAQAARDLERMARDRLAEAGFIPEALTAFAGPRRLTLVAQGLPTAQADRSEERKGPRVGAPDAAVDGFLRSTGLTREQLVERDGVWFATLSRQGRPTADIIAEMVEAIVRNFPWPKSMKWGTSALRWVRPLRRILCVFDGEVVPFAIEGIESGDLTEGHRFMGDGKPFRARHFDDYAAGLAAHFVVLDPAERKARITQGAKTLCFARGLELVEDEGLLDEVCGLAEWPTPILGDMDPAFLDLPPEVIRTSMRTHQKYFAVRRPGEAGLAPHFLAVANIEATDGGAAIAKGNARVLSARLNDARFFWDEDRKVPLESRLEKLKGVTFHAKLGTMYERVERVEALAREIAPLVGADPAVAAKAARLAKADLGTGMVGEFPELQGVIGRYYAAGEGMDPVIADAIRDHYKPQGPGDAVPSDAVGATVALADKLDTLIAFFAIGEKPTGSRDPFALRRAALGVIRVALEKDVRIDLSRMVALTLASLFADQKLGSLERVENLASQIGEAGYEKAAELAFFSIISAYSPEGVQQMGAERWPEVEKARADLHAFFADRLKVSLRDQGKRHDLVDAVFALGDDDIVRIVARVEALDGFLTTEDGKNLLAGYKRATNILKAEEKKEPLPTGAAERLAGAPAEEAALIDALAAAEPEVGAALAKEDFAGAMRALAGLRAPVDAFFEKVLVNDPDVATRHNRLRLLTQVRDAMGRVADFSLVSG